MAPMETNLDQLDELRNACKAAVDHDVAKLDLCEQAHFSEDAIRAKAKESKKVYEDALREQIYGF